MVVFRETLEYCEMYDLGFSRQWYTWERGRLVDNNIRERLDRGVANTEWWNLFPGYKVSYIQHSFSDHCLIVMDTCGVDELRGGVQQSHFQFNADWILNSRVEEQIKWEWNSKNTNMVEKLRKLGLNLTTWAKKERRLKECRTKDLNGRLLELGTEEINNATLEEITNIKLELNFEADKEELFWEQRAKFIGFVWEIEIRLSFIRM
ncbi:reverse transcriptase [Gossypium australe]|uniref:Reverse transcriptase n=1 Tax=Gossypium australe TaxID=47621 RepID=A0A5B6WXM1_9ROSI|nr:reverse transcriptase [Gossypium australe]